jgi:RNA polymerase sigma-70 factor (ECF subfamily)
MAADIPPAMLAIHAPEESPTGAGAPPVTEVPPIATLVRDYHAFLWRSVRRLGVPAGDVDDAVQELFLIAHRRHSEIVPGKERAFLFAVAVGVAANARRKHQRRDNRLDHGADPAAAPMVATQDHALLARDRRAMLDAVLDDLDDEFRVPFVLFELEEVPVTEIAELLQIPSGTVASRLRRARELFQAAAARLRARVAREDAR